jgi:hypothetical protein
MQARYQNPEVGRFVSQDPIFITSPEQYLVDPQQANSYSYARNNPLILIDSTGEKVELVTRRVGVFGGHMFFKVTPDNSHTHYINGVNPDTEVFTFGAYNPDGNNPFSNRLHKAIGTESSPTTD